MLGGAGGGVVGGFSPASSAPLCLSSRPRGAAEGRGPLGFAERQLGEGGVHESDKILMEKVGGGSLEEEGEGHPSGAWVPPGENSPCPRYLGPLRGSPCHIPAAWISSGGNGPCPSCWGLA